MENKNYILYILLILALVLGGFGLVYPKLSQPQDSGSAGATGDVDRTAHVYQIALTNATNTPCALLNPSGGRDRFIKKVYAWGEGATIQDLSRNTAYSLSIATSSSAYATSSSANYFAKDIATNVFASSSPQGGFYSSSSPAIASPLSIWGAGSYVLFQVGGITATTSSTLTGYCGIEYYTQM